jgi:hypothetical protein
MLFVAFPIIQSSCTNEIEAGLLSFPD